MNSPILAAGLLAVGVVGCSFQVEPAVIHIRPSMAEEHRAAAAEAVLEWAELGAGVRAELGEGPCGQCAVDEIIHVRAFCDEAEPGGRFEPRGVVVGCDHLNAWLGPSTAHDVFLHELGHVLGLGPPADQPNGEGHLDPVAYPGDVMNPWVEQMEGGGPSFVAAAPYSRLSIADLQAMRAWHPEN